MRSDPTLKKWYNLINRKFFDNYLPCDTCVRWSNEYDEERCDEKYHGWANLMSDADPENEGNSIHGKATDTKVRFLIVISKTLRKSQCTKLHTLAHEMCHVATGLKDEHGPAFEHWRQYIADRGIFKKGALLKRLTIF